MLHQVSKNRQGELVRRLRDRRLHELSVFNSDGNGFGSNSNSYRRYPGAALRQIAKREDLEYYPETQAEAETRTSGSNANSNQNRLPGIKRPMTTSVQPFGPQRQPRQPIPRSEATESELTPDEWRALYARLLSRIDRRNDSFYMLSLSPRNDYLFLPPLSSRDPKAQESNATSQFGNMSGLNFSSGSVNWSSPSARPRVTLLVPTLLILGALITLNSVMQVLFSIARLMVSELLAHVLFLVLVR